MIDRRDILSILAIFLLLAPASACTEEQSSRATLTQQPAPTLRPTITPGSLSPTVSPPTATPTALAPPLPTETAAVYGPALSDVQFALDVDQAGQLVFPATEFVRGVTRVYVRFSYQGLGDVSEVETVWYLNENPVSTGRLSWDGGESGDYIIWLEDSNGLGRGGWRWELMAVQGANGQDESVLLGGGVFTVGAGPSYTNAAWGLSFDPPVNWKIVSETPDFVTFSSPDQKSALAVRVAPGASDLSEVAATDLALFKQDHPNAQVLATEAVTMSGKDAILQRVGYTDQEGSEQVLFIAATLHAGSAFSLWLLSPADDDVALEAQLVATLHSVRISTDE